MHFLLFLTQLWIEKWNATAQLQHCVHHTLDHTGLIAVSIACPQLLFVVEQTVSLGRRQCAYFGVTDYDPWNYCHGNVFAGLYNNLADRAVRKVLSIVNHDVDSVESVPGRNVPFGFGIQKDGQTDIFTVTSNSIDWGIQLIGNRFALVVS